MVVFRFLPQIWGETFLAVCQLCQLSLGRGPTLCACTQRLTCLLSNRDVESCFPPAAGTLPRGRNCSTGLEEQFPMWSQTLQAFHGALFLCHMLPSWFFIVGGAKSSMFFFLSPVAKVFHQNYLLRWGETHGGNDTLSWNGMVFGCPRPGSYGRPGSTKARTRNGN